ncbi:MAG: nitroreductase family protein [Candidatus Omnitrophota bacterium]
MDALEAIKKRRSIREYKDKPILKDLLGRIVDAGRFAATARDIQPWEFIVITDPAILKRIGEIAENGKFVSKAKACIAVYSSDTKYYLEDGCAATQNMLVAATAEGIASCWVAGDKKPYCNDISNLLHVPSGFKLISLISLGHPRLEEDFRIKEKRPLGEVLHWEKF